jgi:hypothetical protein
MSLETLSLIEDVRRSYWKGIHSHYSVINMEQAFAKKLLHIPRCQREEIEYEASAITKIHEKGVTLSYC